jgi:hypothetical protein
VRRRIPLEIAWVGLLWHDDEHHTWYRPAAYVTPRGYVIEGPILHLWAEDRLLWREGDAIYLTKPVVFPLRDQDLVLLERVPGERTPDVFIEAEFKTSL